MLTLPCLQVQQFRRVYPIPQRLTDTGTPVTHTAVVGWYRRASTLTTAASTTFHSHSWGSQQQLAVAALAACMYVTQRVRSPRERSGKSSINKAYEKRTAGFIRCRAHWRGVPTDSILHTIGPFCIASYLFVPVPSGSFVLCTQPQR